MERRRGRKEDEVRARGFTLTELIIGLTLLLLVAMLTFPLYSKHASLRRQREAKTQLAIIQQAEEQYWLLHGTYTSDPARLAGWKDRSGPATPSRSSRPLPRRSRPKLPVTSTSTPHWTYG